MKKRLLLFLMGFLLVAVNVLAQQKTITGRVSSANDQSPLPSVSVKIKETNQGVGTDAQGNYSIRAEVGQTLIFTFIGSESKAVIVTDSEDQINISLDDDQQALEEVVVVGFGTQKRTSLTGAVSTVDVEKTLQTRPITDVARGLQGAVAGLNISTPSGALGQNPTVRLRGVTGSLNAGAAGAEPLILVDNVEVPSLNMVNPNDIESMSVVKDAAAAIYGTRAAFGVILITTKSGKRNTPTRIEYSNNLAWQQPTKTPDIASAAEGATAQLSAARRENPSQEFVSVVGTRIDDLAIERMREWESLYGGQNLGMEMVEGRDWEMRGGGLFFYRPWDAPEMYMRNSTPQQNHNLAFNGGSENINYNIGLGYLNEGGVLKVNPDKFERYNLNLGLNATVNKYLDVFTKVLYSSTNYDQPYSFNGDIYDPWFYLYRWPKTFPYGTIDGQPLRNSITEVEQAEMNTFKRDMTRITLGGKLNILPGLTLDADYTYTGFNQQDHINGGSAAGLDFWSGGGLVNRTFTSDAHNRVAFTNSRENRHVVNAYATYNKSFSDHHLKLTGGFNMETFRFGSQTAQRLGLMDPKMPELPLATGQQTVNGAASHWTTLGYFARANYDYKNKYLLELIGRYDGSSRFPLDDTWGFFPSASAGYVLSEEAFMDFAKPYLSFLKIRASYGSVGQQEVGLNRFLSTMPITPTSNINGQWLIGDAFAPTLDSPVPVSGTLTWETVTTREIGLDANFFDNKLNLVFNRYRRTISDMLSAGVTLPSSFGAESPVRNFGEMQTNGWELELGYQHAFNNGLNVSVRGQLSDFTEKITKFENIANISTTGTSTNHYQGKVIGEIWGYETDRFFTRDDFQQDANGNLITTDNGRYILVPGIADQSFYEAGNFFFGPGDVKYRDLNGDGVIDVGDGTAQNPGDRRIIGNTTPRYFYGLRMDFDYKGFDFGFFLQGVAKRDLWASGTMFIPGFRNEEAWYQHQMDYWTEENPNAFYPRPTMHNQSNGVRNMMPQTRYLLDMSYLRLKNLTFGYTFPEHLTNKIKMQRIRVFFSGENLFEFDNVDVPIDPEVDYTTLGENDPNSFGRVYPYRRTFSFGIQATL